MSSDETVEVEDLLADLEDAERELVASIESPECNTEEVREEVVDLFELLETVLRKYDDLASRVESLDEGLESEAERAERARERREAVMDRLGVDDTDE